MALVEAVMVTVRVLLVFSLPNVQVTPASVLATLQVKFVVAEKLLIGVKVTVDVPLPPGAIVTLLGETVSEKSAAGVVKLAMLDQVPFWPLEAASACTSQ